MLKPVTVPEPGEVIAGKYRVERVLGSGGMGVVFAVEHCVTRKRFAVKWLLPEYLGNQAIAERFIREAQVGGRFDHPNVVQVYDLVQHEAAAPFMVMELLTGESLAERLQQRGRLSAVEACRILIPCMAAVSAAHEVGIIHRDLKPANIFLCRQDGHVAERSKVLDFGIAKLLPHAAQVDGVRTRTGEIIGSPHYMAPEQMRGKPVDERVDVYAFGVTLYELLCGERPFEATMYTELVLKVTEATPEPLEQRVPELPAGLAGVVARAMARDPDTRYASVETLMRALLPYLGVETIDAASAATVVDESVWRGPLTSLTSKEGSEAASATRWMVLAVVLLLSAGAVTLAIAIGRQRAGDGTATQTAINAAQEPQRVAQTVVMDASSEDVAEPAAPEGARMMRSSASGAVAPQAQRTAPATPVSAPKQNVRPVQPSAAAPVPAPVPAPAPAQKVAAPSSGRPKIDLGSGDFVHSEDVQGHPKSSLGAGNF